MECAIEIDGIDFHYNKTGSGPAMIVMHGWGCSSATVLSIARVAETTHTVYNVDFPGFGATPEPDAVWGVEDYTRLIEKFADRIGIENPVLLGHSFGGRVAILFASRRAASKVILVDAAGLKPRRSLRYYFKVYSFKLMKRMMYLVYGKKNAEQRLEVQRKRRGSADYALASPKMRAILSRVVNEDLTPFVPLIKAPTLLIWGEDDNATPLWMAKKLNSMIKDSGLVSFPHCGHYSFLDNQAGFAAVLRSFLSND